MNPIKSSLALAVALVLSAAAPAVLAQPHAGMGGMRHGGGFPGHQLVEMLDDIGASDAQRTQIETIFKTAREELRGEMQEGRGTHQQMLKLWAAPSIDAAAIDALRKQQLAQHERASARMQAAFIEAGRVLTPEQRAKLAERAGKRMARMEQRMQGRHGR